jgi:hypothetical protein
VLPAVRLSAGTPGNDIVQNRRLTCQILLILPRDARTRIESSPPALPPHWRGDTLLQAYAEGDAMVGSKSVALMVAAGLMILAASSAQADSLRITKIQDDDAVAVYDELVGRFGTARQPALHTQVAHALFNKAARFAARGRRKQAKTAYSLLIKKFGTAREPAVMELVELARTALSNRKS